jgi:hypothetical protein
MKLYLPGKQFAYNTVTGIVLQAGGMMKPLKTGGFEKGVGEIGF